MVRKILGWSVSFGYSPNKLTRCFLRCYYFHNCYSVNWRKKGPSSVAGHGELPHYIWSMPMCLGFDIRMSSVFRKMTLMLCCLIDLYRSHVSILIRPSSLALATNWSALFLSSPACAGQYIHMTFCMCNISIISGHSFLMAFCSVILTCCFYIISVHIIWIIPTAIIFPQMNMFDTASHCHCV